MTPQELASEMTEKEANNVIRYWEEHGNEKFNLYKQMVGTGYSKTLAVSMLMLVPLNAGTYSHSLRII